MVKRHSLLLLASFTIALYTVSYIFHYTQVRFYQRINKVLIDCSLQRYSPGPVLGKH